MIWSCFVGPVNVSASKVKKSGYYYTILQTNKNDYGLEYSKKVKKKGNKITIYGKMSYAKKEFGK